VDQRQESGEPGGQREGFVSQEGNDDDTSSTGSANGNSRLNLPNVSFISGRLADGSILAIVANVLDATFVK
jgi:hypothetical protein